MLDALDRSQQPVLVFANSALPQSWSAAQYLNATFIPTYADITFKSIQQSEDSKAQERTWQKSREQPARKKPSSSSEPFNSIAHHQMIKNGLQSRFHSQKHYS